MGNRLREALSVPVGGQGRSLGSLAPVMSSLSLAMMNRNDSRNLGSPHETGKAGVKAVFSAPLLVFWDCNLRTHREEGRRHSRDRISMWPTYILHQLIYKEQNLNYLKRNLNKQTLFFSFNYWMEEISYCVGLLIVGIHGSPVSFYVFKMYFIQLSEKENIQRPVLQCMKGYAK